MIAKKICNNIKSTKQKSKNCSKKSKKYKQYNFKVPLEHYFKDLNSIDAVILGCTHFPLIENKISSYLNSATTIHSGDAIVDYLKLEYNCNNKFKETIYGGRNL
mgnify:CR=1 FL=1